MAKTVEVRLQVTGGAQFQSEMDRSASSTQKVGTEAVTAESKIASLGGIAKSAIGSFIGFGSAQAAIAIGTGAFADLRKEVIGFDDSLTSAAAVMGGVTGEIKSKMADTARSVAIEWGQTESAVVGVFRVLGDAGLNAQQAIAVLPQSVAFAKASLLDLNTAADTVVKLQDAFSLKSEDPTKNAALFTHVTDVISEAARLSVTSVSALSLAMTKAGPIGAGLGLSIEQVAATLADMADKGFDGRRALLGFTQLFQELPAKADKLSGIGVKIFDDAGKILPASTIVDEFTKRLAGLSNEQQQAVLTSAGLSVATQKVIIPLLGTGDALRAYDTALKNSSGTTQDIADKAMQSFASRLGQVRAILIAVAQDGIVEFSQFVAFLQDRFGPGLARIGQIVVDVAGFFAPLVALLGGAAFKAGEVTLEALATAIDTVGSFLQKHEAIVELVAAAYGVKLVAGLASAFAAFLDLQRVRLGVMFLDAQQATEGFVTQLFFAEGAGQKLRAVFAAMGPTLAIAFAAEVIVGFVQSLHDADTAASKMVDSLTVKPTGNDDIFSAWSKSVTQLSAQLDEVDKQRKTLSDNPLDLLKNVTKQAADFVLTPLGFGSAITGTALDIQAAGSHLSAAAADYQAKAKVLHDTLDSIRHDVYGAAALDLAPKPATGTASSPYSSNQLNATYATQASQLKTLDSRATKLGIDLSDPSLYNVSNGIGTLTPAGEAAAKTLHDAALAAAGLSPAGQEAALALTAVGNAADTGTDKISAMETALKDLLDVAFGTDNALDKVSGDLLDVASNAVKTAAGGGKLKVSFSENTKEGIQLRQTLRGTIGDIAETGLQVLSTTGNMKQARDTVALLRQSFIDTATKAGVPLADVMQLASVLDQVTAKTLKPGVDSTKIKGAKTDTDKVKTGLDELGKVVAKPSVDLNTTAFDAKIAATQTALNKLNGTKVIVNGQVPATVPGSGGKTFEPPPGSSGTGSNSADGNIFTPYSTGGEDHVAQVARAGDWRVWAEPETGGEAYIPLSPSKRGRSTTILEHVAETFGYKLEHYADGGVNQPGVQPGTMTDRNGKPIVARIDPAVLQFYTDQARYQIELLNIAFKGIGSKAHVEMLTDAQMRNVYSGVTIYGSKTGTGDAIANGDPGSGKIQVNAEMIERSGDPMAYLHAAITKEYAQVVLPHFVNSDPQIAAYFKAIGYHPKTDEHLVDDLWQGQAAYPGGNGSGTPGYSYTTPADLFGYFLARSIDAGDTFSFQPPPKIIAELREAGLLPLAGRAKELLTLFFDLSSSQTHGKAFKAAVESIIHAAQTSTLSKRPDDTSFNGEQLSGRGSFATSTYAPPEPPAQVGYGGHRFFADGGMHEQHDAQISHTQRVWAEPETGGEAYVPLAPAKRDRSTQILGHVADQFGLQLTPKSDGGIIRFADGGTYGKSWNTGAGHPVPNIDNRVQSWSTVNNVFNDSTVATKIEQSTQPLKPTQSVKTVGAPAVPAYVGQDIVASQASENAVNYNAAAQKNTKSFQLAAFYAAVSVQAPDLSTISNPADRTKAQQQYEVDRQKAIDDALHAVGQTYTDVAAAAGKSAADQLAASGLVGKAWDDAAAKIIADAQEQKQTHRTLVDDEYSNGKISNAQYLKILNDRLAQTKKFSADWLALHEQIAAVQTDEHATENQLAADAYQHQKLGTDAYLALLERQLAGTTKYSKAWLALHEQIVQVQDARQQATQQQFDSFAQPFRQQTDVVAGLAGNANGVAGSDITGFLSNAIASAKQFGEVIKQLLAKGFDRGTVEEIERQGPKALPLAQAMLSLPVAQVNSQVRQLASLGDAFGAQGVATFGTTDASTHLQVGNVQVNIGGAGVVTKSQVQTMITSGLTAVFAQIERNLTQGKKKA